MKLRRIAKIVGGIVEPHVDGALLHNEVAMVEALRSYSEVLRPWASRVVTSMLKDVIRRNTDAWEARTAVIGSELRSMLTETNVGRVAQALHDRQVTLITSLPVDAGARAQALAREAMLNSTRASETAQALARTEQVTASRATLIARTETAKANAAVTQARAEAVGVTHYFWRTMGDADVRESHAELDGEVFAFDDPPEVGDEGAHGPGEVYNCRCYAEPIIGPVDEG